jgi:hypothetical protein
VIDVDVVERVLPAPGMPGQAEDVSLASGQVHLPYLVHSLMLWRETAPMWGEGGGPQIYVDAFLRWIERKFWFYWWPHKGSPVGLSLDDFIDMTWGVAESEHEMDDTLGATEPPLEVELGLDIAPRDRRERGVLLARNGRFLAVDLRATPGLPATCMRTGGGGPELVWMASRSNRVHTPLCTFFPEAMERDWPCIVLRQLSLKGASRWRQCSRSAQQRRVISWSCDRMAGTGFPCGQTRRCVN